MKNTIKNILIYAGMLIVGIGLPTGILFMINILSCISMPDPIKDEPMICAEARQWAYLAATSKSKAIPESVPTEGARSCNAILRFKECVAERDKYIAAHKLTGNDYQNLIIENNATNIMNLCVSHLKP